MRYIQCMYGWKKKRAIHKAQQGKLGAKGWAEAGRTSNKDYDNDNNNNNNKL
jgi:hypothetical protein